MCLTSAERQASGGAFVTADNRKLALTGKPVIGFQIETQHPAF